ncbi:hypothetical protein Tco_0538511 [Tanacetum coccineum]
MREGTIKPRHQDLEWFGYKALLRPTPLPTRDFTMSTSSLQAEKTVYTSLTLFSDTKLNINHVKVISLGKAKDKGPAGDKPEGRGGRAFRSDGRNVREDCTCHPCVGDRKIRERELRSDVPKVYRHPRQRLGIGRLLHSQGVKNSTSKQYSK